MANKVINTILNLRNNMSPGLITAAKNTKAVSEEMVSATRSVVQFKNKTVSSVTSAAKSFVKLGAAAGGAVAALAAKTGFSEAMDLEGYRLQLETATKDTQKASKIMQYAINLANKTPFEGGELVEGAAKFEAMGMSAETWLSRAGDMAAATNKGFDQAVEALIDAQTGELERLKEFGITKAKILEQGEKMFAGVQIANNSGQIVNQEKFNEAMLALMEDRFSGGMEKQATTMKGLWSTVTGVTKSSLASIVGITTDGSIRSGSALALLKDKVSLLADRLQQWQQDGTIDRLSAQFTQGLGKAMDLVGAGFQWVSQHGDTLRGVLAGVGTALGIIKIVKFASDVHKTITTTALFGKTLLALVGAGSPIGWVVLGVTALSTAVGVVAANWDTVKAKAGAVLDWIGGKLTWLNDKIEGIPIIGAAFKGIKSWAGKAFDFSGINWGIGGHATGTSYFAGGLTRINERGGEIVNLPGGTQIIPHDVSARMVGGARVTVYVTVQGNVIGNDAYADALGNTIAQRILRALRNT